MKNIKKRVLSFLMVGAVMLGINVPAHAEWKQDKYGWWFNKGDSYCTNWNNINEKWYCFDKKGYMLYSTIKNGYFIPNNGAWLENPPEEVKKYISLLKDSEWQYEYSMDNIMVDAVMDINNDGKYEMILSNGSSEAKQHESIISYDNGKIKIDNLYTGACVNYYGMIKDENIMCFSGYRMDHLQGSGYKLENGKWTLVYKWSAALSPYDNSIVKDCILNDKSVSVSELNQFLNKIDKYYHESEF